MVPVPEDCLLNTWQGDEVVYGPTSSSVTEDAPLTNAAPASRAAKRRLEEEDEETTSAAPAPRVAKRHQTPRISVEDSTSSSDGVGGDEPDTFPRRKLVNVNGHLRVKTFLPHPRTRLMTYMMRARKSPANAFGCTEVEDSDDAAAMEPDLPSDSDVSRYKSTAPLSSVLDFYQPTFFREGRDADDSSDEQRCEDPQMDEYYERMIEEQELPVHERALRKARRNGVDLRFSRDRDDYKPRAWRRRQYLEWLDEAYQSEGVLQGDDDVEYQKQYEEASEQRLRTFERDLSMVKEEELEKESFGDIRVHYLGEGVIDAERFCIDHPGLATSLVEAVSNRTGKCAADVNEFHRLCNESRLRSSMERTAARLLREEIKREAVARQEVANKFHQFLLKRQAEHDEPSRLQTWLSKQPHRRLEGLRGVHQLINARRTLESAADPEAKQLVTEWYKGQFADEWEEFAPPVDRDTTAGSAGAQEMPAQLLGTARLSGGRVYVLTDVKSGAPKAYKVVGRTVFEMEGYTLILKLVDSGSNQTITRNKQSLNDVYAIDGGMILETAAKGATIKVTHGGNLTEQVQMSDGSFARVNFGHALYVPNAGQDLYSFGRLEKDGWRYMLEGDDPNKASFIKAGESIRLFSDEDNMKFVLVRIPNAETKQAAATQLSSNMAAAVRTVEHQQGWSAGETAHCLFGHLEDHTITTTQKLLGMPVTNHLTGGTAHNCPICKMQKTKSKRNLVPSDTVASMQYSRITMDVHPLASPIPTVGGMVSAILHIVDVYSARGFLYDLLAGKSDQVVPILTKLISDGHSHDAISNYGSKFKIQIIATDNDSRFTSEVVKNYCIDNGITIEFSCAYNQWQNPAESHWGPVVTMARALQAQSCLPDKFRRAAAYCAVDILNHVARKRVHVKNADGKGGVHTELWSPQKLFMDGQVDPPPDFGVYGALCFFHNPEATRSHKHADRGIPGVWLGRAENYQTLQRSKGHYVLDLLSKRVVLVPFVSMVNDCFPFRCGPSNPMHRNGQLMELVVFNMQPMESETIRPQGVIDSFDLDYEDLRAAQEVVRNGKPAGPREFAPVSPAGNSVLSHSAQAPAVEPAPDTFGGAYGTDPGPVQTVVNPTGEPAAASASPPVLDSVPELVVEADSAPEIVLPTTRTQYFFEPEISREVQGLDIQMNAFPAASGVSEREARAIARDQARGGSAFATNLVPGGEISTSESEPLTIDNIFGIPVTKAKDRERITVMVDQFTECEAQMSVEDRASLEYFMTYGHSLGQEEEQTEKVRQLIDLSRRVNEAYRQIEEDESAEGKVLSVLSLPDAKDCVNMAQVKQVSEMEEDMSFDYQTEKVVWLNDLIMGKDNSDWNMDDGDSDSELEYEDDGQCRKIKQGSGSTKMMTHAAVLKLPPEMRDRYLQAGRQEFEGWYRNNAIVDVYNPRDDNAVFIDSSMKYRLKANGNAKGRACLRGDQMREGTDFDKTFAPTPGATASKIVIALSTMQGKPLYTTDNSMAFLNVDIGIDPTDPLATRALYVRPPVGYRKDEPGRIHYWRALKAGYGIPQGPRLYAQWIVPQILSLGFEQCEIEQCLYTHRERDMSVVRQTDDHLISAWEDDAIWFREALRAKGVPISQLEVATNFNGLEIRQVADGTYVSQCRYTWDILNRFDFQDAKLRSTPQRIRRSDDLDDGTLVECPVVKKRYAGAVGAATYLAANVRSDVAVATARLARGLMKPTVRQVEDLEYLMGYLRNTWSLGIKYNRAGHLQPGDDVLQPYGDASFGVPELKLKGISGRQVLYGGGSADHQAKTQATVATSVMEAEVMQASELAKRVIFLRALLAFLGQKQEGPTDIYCDNEAAVWFASREEFAPRMRHLNIRLYAIREMVKLGHVRVVHVAGAKNIADILTKQVDHQQFVYLRDIGMCWVPKELMD